MPYNFVAEFSGQKNFVADFLQAKCDLTQKRSFCVCELPFGGLGAMYDDHLRLTGKRVVGFLLLLIEFYSLCVMAEALRANIGSKSAIPV